MSKIFQLSKRNDAETSQVANDKDNKQQGILMLAFVIFLYVITVYCFWEYGEIYLPDSASEHGGKYDTLMFISIGLIMFVQIITQGLLHYFAFKYKGKKVRKHYFMPIMISLEFIWTIIPVITLAGLLSTDYLPGVIL